MKRNKAGRLRQMAFLPTQDEAYKQPYAPLLAIVETKMQEAALLSNV